MLIILETSRAEELHWTRLAILQLAEEVARLYGADQVSHTTLLEILGIGSDRSPLRVFESTPVRRPNTIMQHWMNSMRSDDSVQRAIGNVRGMRATELFYNEE